MAKNHGPQIKNDKQYGELKKQGMSKEKAARIANASNNSSKSAVGRKGGERAKYEDWTKKDLEKRASEIGIEGRSKMDKGELISAMRHH